MLNKFKLLALFAMLVCLFQSCTEDNEIISSDFRITDENEVNARRGGDRPSGQDLARLEHTVSSRWIKLFLELERYAAGMRPNASARAMAYIALAAYETGVPGMPDFESNSGRIPDFRISNEALVQNIDWEMALNACYANVLNHFLLNVPEQYKGKITDLEAELDADLRSASESSNLDDSNAWGSAVAAQVIAYSQTDAEAEGQVLEPQPLSYEPPTGEGYWTYSAEQERGLFPYWEKVRTFVVSPQRTTSLPPVEYSENPSSNYFSQMKEVYESNNNARTEDGEDLWIAEFWSDDVENMMFSPPARQFSIAQQLVDQFDLNLDRTLYLYLKLGFSLNDAAVSTWKYKYDFMVMRPNVFIHEFIDPNYQTNLYRLIPWPNPTFPSYPSGHSAFASAAAGVFIEFFDNRVNFTDRSHEDRVEFRGAARTFNSFREMAEENAYSRIPLGVHMRMDCTEGLRLGYEISDAIDRYDLDRRDRRPR
ncbi:MAG: hypothetical protein Sapg2KO_37450 [Saprospiraceae bacterium]